MGLTKTKTKILDALIAIENSGEEYNYQAFVTAVQPPSTIALIRACRSLKDDDYLEDFQQNVLGEILEISLNDKGANYKEYQRLLHREQWFASVWLPVIVAFITTLLAQYALPELWRWLVSLLQQMKQ